MFFAGITYVIIKKSILDSENSFNRTAFAAPFIMFVTAFVIALFIIYKGAKGVGLHKTPLLTAVLASLAIGVILMLISVPVSRYIKGKLEAKEALAEGMTPSSMLRLRTKGVSEPTALFQNVLVSRSNSRSMAVAMRARASRSQTRSCVD